MPFRVSTARSRPATFSFCGKTADGSLLVTEFDGIPASDIRLGMRLEGGPPGGPDFSSRYPKDLPRAQWEIAPTQDP